MHENDKLQVQGGGYHWESKVESEFKELTKNSHGTNHVFLTLDGGYILYYYCTFFYMSSMFL